MALNVQSGTIAPPGSNGGTTSITLPAGFDPKAILFFPIEAASGSAVASFFSGLGMATKDGGAIQQGAIGVNDANNQASAVLSQSFLTTRCIYLSGTTTSVEAKRLEGHIAAAGDWSDTNITITFPTVTVGASQTIAYLALGGSDITSAKVGSFALSTGLGANGTQDVAVNYSAGGQPDLLLFAPSHNTATGWARSDQNFGLGFAKSDTDRFCSIFKGDDGHTTNEKASIQKARAFCTFVDNGVTLDSEIDLAAKANWPADSFRLVHADPAARASQILYLALKGTFTSTLVNASTITAGSTQDHAHGSAPKAFLSASTLVAATDSVDSSSAQLGGMSFGVSDLTNEAATVSLSDDGAATSIVGRALSTTKALYTLDLPTASAPVSRGQADATASGNNLRLTYTTLDNVAREYIGLVLGAATAQTISAGKASETDSGQAVARSKKLAAGQPVETDSPQALGARKVLAAGSAPETDSARTLAWAPKARLVAQAVETAAAQAVGKLKALAAGRAIETETAAAVAARKRLAAVQAAETETAQAVASRKLTTAGQPAETDEARPVTAAKGLAIAPTAETDTAQPVTPLGEQTIQVGQASETNTARSIALPSPPGTYGWSAYGDGTYARAPFATAVGRAVETDTAGTVTVRKAAAVGQAADTEAAQPVGVHKTVQLGPATETDISTAGAARRAATAGQATETDAARTVTSVTAPTEGTYGWGTYGEGRYARTNAIIISRASEHDVSPRLAQRAPVGRASETDQARASQRRHTRTVARAQQTEQARPVRYVRLVPVVAAGDTSVARTVTYHARPVGRTAEQSAALPVLKLKRLTVRQALDLADAQALRAVQTYFLYGAGDIEMALPLRGFRSLYGGRAGHIVGSDSGLIRSGAGGAVAAGEGRIETSKTGSIA